MSSRAFWTTALLIVAPALAFAQDATNPATKAYSQAMGAMHDKMLSMKPMNDPDMDFVMMMKPHHQAAVEMAEVYLKYGSDPKLKTMARDIVTSQKREIDQMSAWEGKHGMKP